MSSSSQSVPPVVPSKKKKRSKRKPKVAEQTRKESEAKSIATSVASEALKKGLKKRLRAKMKMMTVARSGGTSQDVQNVLKQFNDGDDEKAELMKEIQDDVKGMRQKDAKKYLKQVLGSMNREQTDSFVDMVKDKVPSSQSSNIVNYVKRHKKVQEKDDQKKPKVNPETVYTPARFLSDEAKAQAKAQRPPTEKKKKTFGRVNIQVPKLSELRDHPTIEAPLPVAKPTKKKAAPVSKPQIVDLQTEPKVAKDPIDGVPRPKRQLSDRRRLQDIEALFPQTKSSSTEEQEAARLTFFKRIRNVQQFDPTKMEGDMRQFMFEASDMVEVLWIREVEFLKVSDAMEVPGTQEVIALAQIPSDLRLKLEQHKVASRPDHAWIYKYADHDLVRIRNAYPECAEFLKSFDKVRAWIVSLKDKKVPWKWFCELMNDLGVLRQKNERTTDKQWAEHFRVLCHEYKSATNNLTVPIVPFVKLVVSC